MTHGEFIVKRNLYKPMFEFWAGSKTWREVADEFDLAGPLQAANAVRFYERHKGDPVCEILGSVSHYMAGTALGMVHFKTVEQMRGELIRKFSASIGISRAYPKDFPQRILRILLKASGLEWFQKDERCFVHWKHDKEAIAA